MSADDAAVEAAAEALWRDDYGAAGPWPPEGPADSLRVRDVEVNREWAAICVSAARPLIEAEVRGAVVAECGQRFRAAAELTVDSLRAEVGDQAAEIIGRRFAEHFDRADLLAERMGAGS